MNLLWKISDTIYIYIYTKCKTKYNENTCELQLQGFS